MIKKIQAYYDYLIQDSFRIRLFFGLSFILFALVIVGLSFIVNYNYESKFLQKTIQQNANKYIQNQINNINGVFTDQKRHLLSLTNNTLFRSFVNTQEKKADTIALFQHIIDSDENIMQFRYLDKDGQEVIRIDRSEIGGKTYIIPNEKLQNKADRYYFTETKKLSSEKSMWVSDIDLNIENGQIERPFNPTIRFSIPLYQKSDFQGIIIINLFMKDILDTITKSDMFLVSLMDVEGNFLIGKNQVGHEILDYSWSKYLTKKIDTSNFAPRELDKILESYEYASDTFFSKNISKDINLRQELVLVLKVKESSLRDIKDDYLHKIFYSLALVLLFSGPIAIILAFIPSSMANKIISIKNNLKEKNLLFDEYIEAMNVNNIITKGDIKGKITYVNDNFCKVTGYSKEEILGKPHSVLRDPDGLKETFKIMWLTIQSGRIWKGILRNRKKDGGFYDVDIAVTPILDAKGNIIEYLAIRHDITELVEQRKSLMKIANTDPLTNTGNRYKLIHDINMHILNNLAVVDLDNFSNINDLYGHEIGDEVIVNFGELLKSMLNDEYKLYRLHGDKFAILNSNTDCDTFTKFIMQLNAQLNDAIVETSIKGFDIATTAGISSKDNKIIISTAEIANKHAKEINKKVLTYSKELNIESKFQENIKWTEKIKKALHEERFIVYYQPIFNNATQKIDKYEALIRMREEDGTIISPFHFLNIAKSSGQYIDITKVVIKQSFEKFQHEDVSFSINLTIEDILDNDLVSYFDDMLEKYGVAHKLILELVESEGIRQFDRVLKFIRKVKSLGCKIAIDDFGTGYSNFEYLIKLEADIIKIDGSMIKNINTDANTKEIVETIIQFAKKMHYKTVAEFVASEDILQTVQQTGIDFSQGYFVGAPEPELVKEL